MIAVGAETLDCDDHFTRRSLQWVSGNCAWPRHSDARCRRRPIPQPYLVPVNWIISRRYHDSGMPGSPSNCFGTPFTLSWIIGYYILTCRGSCKGINRRRQLQPFPMIVIVDHRGFLKLETEDAPLIEHKTAQSVWPGTPPHVRS